MRPRLAAPGLFHEGFPMLTLVITRYDENLDWLNDLPEQGHVVVCNSGSALDAHQLPEGSRVMPLPGTQAGPLGHILYLQQLAAGLGAEPRDANGWTVLAPANAPECAPGLLALLEQPHNWGEVQPLALHGEQPAPMREDRRDWVAGQPVRTERFSLHTLAPVGHSDAQATRLAALYRRRHGLMDGSNLVAHFLGLCGLHELAGDAEAADLGIAAPAGMVAVRNSRLLALLANSSVALHKLESLLRSDGIYQHMLERCWLHLFQLPFIAFAPLPRPQPVHSGASPSMARVVASIDALLARQAPLLSAASAHAAGAGLRLTALDALDDLPAAGLPQPAWIPDLGRIGQIGERLRENALG